MNSTTAKYNGAEREGVPMYQKALARLMEEDGKRADTLVRRLMLGNHARGRIEKGTLVLQPIQLHLAAAVYEVNEEKLSYGRIQKAAFDMEKEIASCRRLFSRLKEALQEQIEKVEAQTGNERFFVKPSGSGDEDLYLIYDAALMDYAKGGDGNPIVFSSPLAALDAAYHLEKSRNVITEMPPDQNADLSSRYTFLIDDGCLYVFDRNRKDPDGDDAIFAFIDREGKGVFFEEPSPNEKACLKKMAESILKTDHHKKQEKEASYGRVFP